ncbi:aminoglycoside phosphotransferase family protein [Parendozoicomonas haliclonae]|uniref:Phosphotransferase enzyme family protein n=1 Tax=Parendozoicomonas haliclonae TaxID=1960125 RepID=A0A1X7AF81_9GAMM|nr:phosphotransferase [Parendozoicomonas haliclonae]SMA35425.1 Phosphotransferase enzyme family protein [Parendozoicomonas haliclonae]
MDLRSGHPDNRFAELDIWCTEALQTVLGRDQHSGLKSVSGDASFRRYFRTEVANDASYIVVDAPPASENCKAFVAIANSWRQQGVRTPAVHSVDLERGYMLLEDFGDTLLYSGLQQPALGDHNIAVQAVEQGEIRAHVQNLYTTAIDALLALQSTQVPEEYPLPAYDAERLNMEMGLFPEWCLRQLLGMELAEDEQNLLQNLFQRFTQSALEQPIVPIHRDYHSRNIMMLPDGLGLIDFQDALMGPVTYDPVSLLRDCYIDWPQARVYEWLNHFAARSPHLQSVPKEQLYQWFDWMGAQRHIKVLGIFVRLWLRDGKTGYLKDLPRVYAYVRWVCNRYSELDDMRCWLDSEVLPRLQQQNWWQDYQLKD